MSQYLDIIILLVVIVLIFQKLKTVLGTRPEMEERQEADLKAAKILTVVAKEIEKQEQTNTPIISSESTAELSDTDKTLKEIPNFNKNAFIKSAEKAFQIITNAFNKGDVETLEMLVNKKIFKKFQEVIEKRKNENISAETDFIGFDKVEITAAKITPQKNAQISVEFVSEQVNVLRNSENEVIEGDENYIQNITDVWTFEKALTSSSPNWLLVSTKKS